MVRGFDGRDAVVDKAGGAAPDSDVAAFETKAPDGVGAALAAPQKNGGDSERDGDDRRPLVLLVAVLMEAELGTGLVAVDQAGMGS